jgi:hypothetical protein
VTSVGKSKFSGDSQIRQDHLGEYGKSETGKETQEKSKALISHRGLIRADFAKITPAYLQWKVY